MDPRCHPSPPCRRAVHMNVRRPTVQGSPTRLPPVQGSAISCGGWMAGRAGDASPPAVMPAVSLFVCVQRRAGLLVAAIPPELCFLFMVDDITIPMVADSLARVKSGRSKHVCVRAWNRAHRSTTLAHQTWAHPGPSCLCLAWPARESLALLRLQATLPAKTDSDPDRSGGSSSSIIVVIRGSGARSSAHRLVTSQPPNPPNP
jgi:hypothetical protein